MPDSFEWDDTLYAGSAAWYPSGRLPYPARLADALRAECSLDSSGRLLDVGCGPGSLTLLLAPLFDSTVGIDADADMIAQAAAEAARAARAATEAGPAGGHNITWHWMRAEELPAELGRFRMVTFAQSFHWVDQPVVASAVLAMLEPGGVCVHVHATTHEGAPGRDPLPFPRPPRAQIADLVARYLGPVRRAGQGTLPAGLPADGDTVMLMTGFRAPRLLEVGGAAVVHRTEDEVVASVFSLSSAAPHLFGDRVAAFEDELRAMLRAASPGGRFSERTRDMEIAVWRPR